jgi:hypothetical protein
MANANDILKQQQAWLDTLQEKLAKPSDSGILSLLGTQEQQAAAIQARIDNLSRQKDAAMQRYDAAINEQKKVLAALQTAMESTGLILQGSASSTGNQSPPKRRSSRK